MPNGMFVYRPLLTQMTIQRGIGEAGVGSELAPLVEHDSINGVYFVRDRQRLGHVDPKRAPGEFVKRMETESGKLEPFLMHDRSIIKTVPEELVDGMAEAQTFEELQNASMEALNEIQFAYEKDVKDLLWGATKADFEAIYGTAAVSTPSTKWDATGGAIRTDVLTLKDTIYKRCGYMPNRLNMTKEVLNTISSDPNNEIGERLKYTSGRIPTAELLAAYFEVDQVILPKNLEDNANPGQPDNYDYMWGGDNVGVFYIDPSQSRKKETLASTFFRDTDKKPFLGVFTRYNQENESYEAKVQASYDVKTVDTFCGGVLYDVLT